MKIVLQRVKRAQVTVDGRITGSIHKGILILLGVHKDDTEAQADFLAAKCAELRIFSDSERKMNISLHDVNGEVLVVSKFTLYGNCRKGRRPSYIDAAPPDKGERLYDYFVKRMKEYANVVQTGIFGAMMDVELVNDGPVTIILER
jgi:D-tyrosyl-tRNA(Tyr) deacylase